MSTRDKMQADGRTHSQPDPAPRRARMLTLHRWPLTMRKRPLALRGQPLALRGWRPWLACALLALVAFGGAVGSASATTYDPRGEWSYTITCSCGQPAEGTMLVKSMNFSTGEFSGTINFDGLLSGTISGTVTAGKLSLKLVLPDTPGGEQSYTMPEGAIESTKNEISGAGFYNSGSPTGEFAAKRTRTIEEVEKEEEERRIRAEKERKEYEAREKAREAKEAEEKAEKAKQEAEELPAIEARKRAEQEAREAREKEEQKSRESASKGNQQTQSPGQSVNTGPAIVPVLQPAEPNGKTLDATGSGLVPLVLANTNGYEISGNVTLLGAGGAKAAGAASRHKAAVLATGSFSIAPHASEPVKLKLSRSAAAALARHRSLRVTVEITTTAAGQPPSTKTYSVTLHAAHRARR
jgi:hypothetical protein